MAQQKREVMAIANSPAPPTFANTVVAMERSGQLLDRANLAFSAVNGANTNDILQATDTKTAPLFAAHNDFIYLNAKLFQRFKTLHDHQAELNLTPEQAKLLDVYYKGFVHAGAELPAAQQVQLKAMNERLSTLQSAFNQKLLAAAKAGALQVTESPRSPDFPTRNSRPRPRTRRAASSPDMSYRCRTRPSNRRCRTSQATRRASS